MCNIALIVILVLHFSPWGLDVTEYGAHDLFIIANLMIQFLLALCVASKVKGKIGKILAGLVVLASVYFLYAYMDNPKPEVNLHNQVSNEQG